MVSLIRTEDRKEGKHRGYQAEGDAHGPDVSTGQHRAIIPIILEFEIGRGRARLSRIEPALRFGIDVHVPLLFLVAAAAIAIGAILDGSGPRYASVPQRGSGGHEERVVDVPRVGENGEVEREEPALAAWDDAEVRGTQRGVREHVVQRRAVVVLQVFERGRGEVRIRGGRTFLMRLSFSAFFFFFLLYAGRRGVDVPGYGAYDPAVAFHATTAWTWTWTRTAVIAVDSYYVFHLELCGCEHLGAT